MPAAVPCQLPFSLRYYSSVVVEQLLWEYCTCSYYEVDAALKKNDHDIFIMKQPVQVQ
jgi:hypothetical protein